MALTFAAAKFSPQAIFILIWYAFLFNFIFKEEQHQYKADKRDYAVAKYMHQHVPKRIGDLHGMEVECFFGKQLLLHAAWSQHKIFGLVMKEKRSILMFQRFSILESVLLLQYDSLLYFEVRVQTAISLAFQKQELVLVWDVWMVSQSFLIITPMSW